jgi:hypothetical protein
MLPDAAESFRHRIALGARRPTTIALGAIVLAGLALRLYFMVQWRPALVGFPDTSIYLMDAQTGVFNDPLRVDGYSEFLRLMHGLRPHLSFAILVQHLLGIASGLLLFGAVHRCGFPRGVALAPAAVVILGGSELLVEHAVLTEAVFIFLVDLALYAIVRAGRGNWAWAILAGLALGTALDDRSVGLALLVVLVPVVLLTLPGPWRKRASRVGIVVAAATVPIAGYLYAHEQAVGYGGFTGSGYFDLYGRVAPFAECSKFHPPAGTTNLCIHIPRSKREGNAVWEFTGISPAVRVFGEPDATAPKPGENSKLLAFSEAAIIGQPLDYLESAGRDLVRIVDPSFSSSPHVGNRGYGNTPESLANYYFNPQYLALDQRVIGEYYAGDGEIHRSVAALLRYERDTRIEGPLMALLLLLAILAPIVTAGKQRRASLLFGATALVLLTAPIFASEYDYRFTIPAFGPLVATASIGAFGLCNQLWPRLPRTLRALSVGSTPVSPRGA